MLPDKDNDDWLTRHSHNYVANRPDCGRRGGVTPATRRESAAGHRVPRRLGFTERWPNSHMISSQTPVKGTPHRAPRNPRNRAERPRARAHRRLAVEYSPGRPTMSRVVELTSYGDPGFNQFMRRSFVKGMGLTDADLQRSMIGLCSSGSELNHRNHHLRVLAEAIKRGVWAASGPLIVRILSCETRYHAVRCRRLEPRSARMAASTAGVSLCVRDVSYRSEWSAVSRGGATATRIAADSRCHRHCEIMLRRKRRATTPSLGIRSSRSSSPLSSRDAGKRSPQGDPALDGAAAASHWPPQ